MTGFRLPLRIKKDDIFVVALSILVALPGYFFTEVSDTGQSVNGGYRFAVVVAILLLVAGRLVLLRSIRIPKPVLGLTGFVVFGLAVAVLRNPPVSYIPTAVRWLIYCGCAVLFANLREPLPLLKKFFAITFAVYAGSALLDAATGRAMNINSALRVVGSVGSAPGLASAIYVSAIGCLYFQLDRSRTVLAIVLAAAAAILLTKTRFVLLAFVAVASLYLFFAAEKGSRLKILLVSLFAVVVIAAYVVSSSDIMQRFAVSPDDLQGDSSSLFRILIIQTLLASFRATDLVAGIGLGAFPLWFKKATGIEGVAPHFELIGVLTETGLIGLFLYVAGLVAFLVTLRPGRRQAGQKGLFYLSALLLVSLQTSLQFSNPTYFYQVMIPVYLTVGTLLHQQRGADGTIAPKS